MLSRVHDDGAALLTIGELAERTGLSVKLIRHWSDIGVVPPAGRTPAGYRLYEPDAVARLELARTLRDLGLGMAAIRAVVGRERGMAEVVAVHADALRGADPHAAVAARGVAVGHQPRIHCRGASLHDQAGTAVGHRTQRDHPRVRGGDDGRPGRLRLPGRVARRPCPTCRRSPPPSRSTPGSSWASWSAIPPLRAAMRRMAEYAAEHAPSDPDERDIADGTARHRPVGGARQHGDRRGDRRRLVHRRARRGRHRRRLAPQPGQSRPAAGR